MLKGEEIILKRGAMDMKQKVAAFVVLFSLALCFSPLQTASQAAPTVDGFMGVPWGANHEQVQRAMEERGFTLLEQRADGIVDKYRGTFTGRPAELTFQYENNVFFEGEAAFLDVKGAESDVVRLHYMEMKELLTAKYGSPAKEYSAENGRNIACAWDLPTTVTPSGRVTIYMWYGKAMYGTGYLGSGLYMDSGFTVRYSIGSTWARLKGGKDIKDL